MEQKPVADRDYISLNGESVASLHEPSQMRDDRLKWWKLSCFTHVFMIYVGNILQTVSNLGAEPEKEIHVKSTMYGVHTLLEEVHPSPPYISRLRAWVLDPFHHGWLKDILDDGRYLFIHGKACYETAPRAFTSLVLLELLQSLLCSLNVYLLGLLLDEAQNAVQGNRPDASVILRKGMSLILAEFLRAQAGRWSTKSSRIARSAASGMFRDIMIQDRSARNVLQNPNVANTRLDVLSAEDPANEATLDFIERSAGGSIVWDQISGVIQLATLLTSAMCDTFVLLSFSRSESNGAIILPIAFLKLALNSRGYDWELPKRSFVFVGNGDMKKMSKLEVLATENRKSVINDGLQQYILDEHRAARRNLEQMKDIDISADWFHEWEYQRHVRTGSLEVFVKAAVRHLSEIVVLVRFAWAGGPFPMKSMTLFVQQANSLVGHFASMSAQFEELGRNRKSLKAVHDALKIPLSRPDGTVTYPTALSTTVYKAGMKVEFRNVTFTYPETTEPVLKDLSFTVEAGQLCVIVGENGSGKSTTVNLLNNTYIPETGEIFVDDLDSREYRAASLRKSQAILDQEYERYPFTLRENIGLGLVEHLTDEERIKTAAKLGGADSFIQKLPKQYEEEVKLNEFDDWPNSNLDGTERDGPLQKRIKAIETGVELSGGQWQRLAISRNFMRAHDNENVRLLCFDEPSSALDPEAEFELFENLRKYRSQKTLIFITHRFGHLTKHADLILCMEDGSIAEQGTHAELVKKEGGMYARMYHMQARAFDANSEHDSDSDSEHSWDSDQC